MTEKFKICLIGATAVGKTSLVLRFMSSIFQERYETTIGVKIQARDLQRGDHNVKLIVWDLSGEDEFQSVQPSYLRGAAGYLIVVDGTRRETIDTAITLEAAARATVGDAPFVVVLNKADLTVSWDIDKRTLDALHRRSWTLCRTSAKTGEGVEEAFELLVDAILAARGKPWT
jgi:small GTP-binding protein